MKKRQNRYMGKMYKRCPLFPFACPGCDACCFFSGACEKERVMPAPGKHDNNASSEVY